MGKLTVATPLILAVLNQKGGVGKSTIAANLAAAAHLRGLRVLVIDLDRQGTALDWYAARSDTSPLAGLKVVKADRALSAVRLRELSEGHDLVVLDGAPRLSDVTRSAAVAADLVLMPIQPNAPDLWAAQETLEHLDQADATRADVGRRAVRRMFVVNRATANSVAARQTPVALAQHGHVCDVVIHNRLGFSEAIALGESVLTVDPDGASAHEIRRLYREVSAA